MIERSDIIEAVQDLEDPEELIADLVAEIEVMFETGDSGGLEEILQGVDEITQIRDSLQMVKSWRDFYGEEND